MRWRDQKDLKVIESDEREWYEESTSMCTVVTSVQTS